MASMFEPPTLDEVTAEALAGKVTRVAGQTTTGASAAKRKPTGPRPVTAISSSAR